MYNLAKDFAQYLEDGGFGTIGVDLYVGDVPLDTDYPDGVMWVTLNGGFISKKNVTGESVKVQSVGVYYRGFSYEDVYNTVQNIEETINSDGCTQLDNFSVLDMNVTTFPIDQDLDSEDRKVGYLEVSLTLYK